MSNMIRHRVRSGPDPRGGFSEATKSSSFLRSLRVYIYIQIPALKKRGDANSNRRMYIYIYIYIKLVFIDKLVLQQKIVYRFDDCNMGDAFPKLSNTFNSCTFHLDTIQKRQT